MRLQQVTCKECVDVCIIENEQAAKDSPATKRNKRICEIFCPGKPKVWVLSFSSTLFSFSYSLLGTYYCSLSLQKKSYSKPSMFPQKYKFPTL